MRQTPLIALLTDFGLTDPYVGQMKAVLMAAAPGLPLLDLTHGIAPQDVRQAAFSLAASLPWLPEHALTVAVVDPGVGTDRRIVLLETPAQRILAPDNGILTLVLREHASCRAFDLTPPTPPASATFHGRDVFAPLAARLACGEAPETLGPSLPVANLVRLEGLAPVRQGSQVTARVLAVDHFGNVVTSCAVTEYPRLPAAPRLRAPVDRPLCPVATYAAIPPETIGLLAGSQGYLELAVPGASAAALLGLKSGDTCILTFPEED